MKYTVSKKNTERNKSMKQASYYLYAFCILLLSSCVSTTSMIYMQEEDGKVSPLEEEFPLNRSDYQLQEGDILQVQITSLDPKINEIFNAGSTMANMQLGTQPGLTNLIGFVVNSSGYVKIPIVGEVVVKGKTIAAAERLIQEGVDKYLKGATAVCKLISPNITVLGEVTRPGTYPIFRNELNLLEAIGMASDLTATADRTNIRVVRPKGNSQITYVINIAHKDFLAKGGFYVQPNDIIYISPTEITTKRSNRDNIPIVAAVISTALSVITTAILTLETLKP